jgi:hypothetical protein
MQELVAQYLSRSISRRSFVRRLAKTGLRNRLAGQWKPYLIDTQVARTGVG